MKAIRRNRLAAIGSNVFDATRIDGQRSNGWLAFPTLPEREIGQWNRELALRKKRWLESNLPLVPAMTGKVSKYSVGAGLFPIPETSDNDWNNLVREKFTEWMLAPSVCDSMGRWSFPEMQAWAASTLFSEGECFAALVNSAQVGAPQLQLFDNGEIRSVAGMGASPGSLGPGQYTYVDGCKLDRNGKIVAYSVMTGNGGDYVDIAASNMIHCATLKRPNQLRAITPFLAGMNDAHSALDIMGLEVASVKLHSILGVVYKKNSGKGVGEGGISGSLSELFQSISAPDGTEDKTQQTAVGENFFGGAATLHLGSDEDVKLLSSERPNENLIEYIKLMYRNFSINSGLPLEVIFDLSNLGGVPSRVCLADAQFLFDSVQHRVARFSHRVYIWWASVLMNRGELPECRDPRWWPCAFLGPAKLSIDRNQTSSEIAALEAGINTLQDYFSARGANWIPKTRQRIIEVKTRMDMCKELGVPYLTAFPQKPGAVPMDSPEDFSDNATPPPAQQAA